MVFIQHSVKRNSDKLEKKNLIQHAVEKNLDIAEKRFHSKFC